MRFNWLIALALGSASAPCLAQAEQTPEGAQRFLAAVAAQGGAKIAWNMNGRGVATAVRTTCVENRGCTDYNLPVPANPITGIEQGERICKTIVRAKELTVEEYAYPQLRADRGWPGTSTFQFKQPTTVWFEWDKAVDIKLDGSSVIVTDRVVQRLDFLSEATATRVAYAMNFLKDACDPTAGTGF